MAFALLVVAPAVALDIDLRTLANSTHPNAGNFDAENPVFDPNGLLLQSVLEHAASQWEDVFEDVHTIEITWFWDSDLPTADPGEQPTISAVGGNVIEDQNGRVAKAMIRFNTNRTDWWFDPTPADDSEFDMAQELFRDLDDVDPAVPMQQYSGNTPDLFETAYTGRAPNGSPADGLRDAVTVALHEMGHAIAMSSSLQALIDEVDGDLDFDLDASKVAGNQMAVLARGHPNNPNPPLEDPTCDPNVETCAIRDPTSHLVSFRALMGANGNDRRKRPSAADVLAISLVGGFNSVDLQRKDFLAGASWNTGFNWLGGSTPSTDDDAYVRHGGTVTLAAFGAAGNLLVDEGSLVSTQDNTLFIQNATTIAGTPGNESQITVNTGGQLDTNALLIDNGGRLVIVSTGLLQAEDVTIAADGELRGFGTVDINSAFGELQSDGLIRATNNGELVVTSLNALALALDGEVEAIDGNIRFETGMAAPASATMTVGADREIIFNDGGTIGTGGSLQLVGTSVSPATVSGSNLFLSSGGVINANGLGIVENVLLVGASSFLTTEYGDPNSELRLNGTTFYQGGTVEGHGIVRQNADALVEQDTSILVNTYDMDGVAGTTTITINPDHTLDIDSPNVDTVASNDFDGTLQVNSGTLDIEPAWRLDGTLNLDETTATNPVLRGAGGVTVDNGGEINITGTADVETAVTVDNGTIFVDGNAEFSGPTTLGDNASVEINNASDSLRLRGTTTLTGPSIVGSGRLILEDNVDIVALNSSIGAAETDLDGLLGNTQILVNDGLTFSISSTTIEPSANDGFDGTITNRGTFSTIVSWRLDGELNMEEVGGTVPTLAGLGTVRIHTTGTYSADGDSIVNPSLEVAGAMAIDNGVTQVNNTASFEATANVVVGPGAELELNAATSFGGGSYTGQGLIQLNNNTTVDSSTTIATARVDLDGAAENSQTVLNNAPLVLNVEGVDETNNLFAGTIDVSGAAARLDVNLSNPLSGWRVTSAGVLNFSTTSAGPVTMLGGSDITVEGQINATGRVRLGANVGLHGTLQTQSSTTDVHFGSGGQNLIFNTAAVAGTGDLTIDDGTRLHLEGGTNVGVSVENAGRLEVGFLTTEVAIDFTEAGSATIRGDFAQTGTGLFGVEVGGLTPASEHDQLEITGTARLGGALEVELIDGFVPDIGDEVVVMLAGSVINTFDTVTALDEGDVFGMDVSVLYSTTDVTVRFDDIFLLGDYNRNGEVEAADYALWRSTLGQMGMNLPADGNGNNEIDSGDYDIWLAHFGDPGAGSGAAAGPLGDRPAVPEPEGMLLAICGVIGFVRNSRRYRPSTRHKMRWLS